MSQAQLTDRKLLQYVMKVKKRNVKAQILLRDLRFDVSDFCVPKLRKKNTYISSWLSVELRIIRDKRIIRAASSCLHSQLLLPAKGPNQFAEVSSQQLGPPQNSGTFWGMGPNAPVTKAVPFSHAFTHSSGLRGREALMLLLCLSPRTTSPSRAPRPTATTATVGWSWWTPSVRRRYL